MTEPTDPYGNPSRDPYGAPSSGPVPGATDGPAFGPYAQHGSPWPPATPPPATPGQMQSAPASSPFGQPPTGQHITDYAPPRNPATWLTLLGVACLIGILAAAAFLRAAPQPVPGAPTAPTSATPRGPGLPFTMPRDSSTTGRWEVVERIWDASGVSVHVRVAADTGFITYGFQAFAKGASTATMPTSDGPYAPELDTGELNAGQVVQGWIYLELPRAESTLFLTTRDGLAISALPIRG